MMESTKCLLRFGLTCRVPGKMTDLWRSEICYSQTCIYSSTCKYHTIQCKRGLGFCFLTSLVACWFWASWPGSAWYFCYIWKIEHKVNWVKIVKNVNSKKLTDNEKLQLNSWKGLGRLCWRCSMLQWLNGMRQDVSLPVCFGYSLIVTWDLILWVFFVFRLLYLKN